MTLADKIHALMPQVQAALIATTITDEKAHELGIHPDELPEHVAADKHANELTSQLAELFEEAWAAPVRTFDDVVLLAEIAQHEALDWVAVGESDGLINPAVCDREAYGRLTLAVLALAGRPFNAHSTQQV